MPRRSDSVEAIVPSRLAFTLVNMSPGLNRVNGGAGIAIDYPVFRCLVYTSSQFRIRSLRFGFPYREEILEFAEKISRHMNFAPTAIDVISYIPAHLGLGSKTASLLGIGAAISRLYGGNLTIQDIAKLAGRGRTSGVGVNVFSRGGFVMDGGHPPSVSEETFLPTRYSSRRLLPPVIFSANLPWPLIVVLPDEGEVFHGLREKELFSEIAPIDSIGSLRLAQVVAFQLAPAVAEANYSRFCYALNEIQRLPWKAQQLAKQSPALRSLIENLRKGPIDSVGLSSNGPALYVFARSIRKAIRWLAYCHRIGFDFNFWVARVPTRGARFFVHGKKEDEQSDHSHGPPLRRKDSFRGTPWGTGHREL